MTQTISTTPETNDIYIGAHGALAIANGQDAVLQACATAAKAQLGEEVLNTTSGIPNFQAIWIGTPQVAIWESYLRTALLAVNGVTKIESLTTTVQNNVLSYTAVIQTQYGRSITLAGELPFG